MTHVDRIRNWFLAHSPALRDAPDREEKLAFMILLVVCFEMMDGLKTDTDIVCRDQKITFVSQGEGCEPHPDYLRVVHLQCSDTPYAELRETYLLDAIVFNPKVNPDGVIRSGAKSGVLSLYESRREQLLLEFQSIPLDTPVYRMGKYVLFMPDGPLTGEEEAELHRQFDGTAGRTETWVGRRRNGQIYFM